jgi:arylsulfatase A-like enzyme
MVPAPKASHFFSEGYSPEELVRKRLEYDEFIAYVDAEFGRLLDFLINTGFLDSSYIMVTSDHGQLFDWGVHGHITPLLYEPLIHIPLIISKPGQTSREDIYLKTSSVDILPTISSIFGRNKSRFEGKLLPGFGGDLKKDNTIYAMEAKMSPRNEVTKIGTYVIIEDQYKLIYYRGYSGFSDVIELYDLVNDPDETEDLHKIKKNIANDLLYMLDKKIIN